MNKYLKKLLNKWIKLHDSVKSSTAFIISSFLLRGIAFAMTPIFTRIMDQTQYGIMATYNSWLSIIEVFALLGLTSAGVFNVGLNEYKHERDRYISSILILVNIVTVVCFGVILIVKNIVVDFLLPYNLIILMFIHFIFFPAQIFWVTRLRYEYKYIAATCVTIASTVISQVIAVITVMNCSNNLGTVKLWANEVGFLLFAIPIYCILLYKGKTYISLSIWKKVLIFAIPLLPHYLAQHVMIGADRIMIAEIKTQADAGIYNVVSNISMIAALFWSCINASIVPYTYEKLETKKYENIDKVVRPLLFVYGIVCLMVILIAPEVIKFLAPQEYYEGLYAIPPIACFAYLSALYNIYANIEFYHKKSKYIARATIISSIANILLNYLLISKFSYIGAAYATLISNIILVICHYMGYRSIYKERIYSDRFIFVFSFCFIGCSLACNILYLNSFIRYVVIFLVLMSLLKYRKIILKKIKIVYYK